MKIAVRLLLAVAVLSLAAAASQAEPRQIVQGTQIKIKLLTDISTSTSRNGDGFIAVTTEPVMLGDQLLLPAGTRIRGIVTSISRARHFPLLRGEAYMNLAFRSVEIDSRLIPVQMSILAIQKPSNEGEGSRRKDVDVTEGQMLQEKHDIKGDIIAGTIGTGGATVIGKTRQPRRRWIRYRPGRKRNLRCAAQGQGSHFAGGYRNADTYGQHRYSAGSQRVGRFGHRQFLTASKAAGKKDRAKSGFTLRATAISGTPLVFWKVRVRLSLLRSARCGVRCALR